MNRGYTSVEESEQLLGDSSLAQIPPCRMPSLMPLLLPATAVVQLNLPYPARESVSLMELIGWRRTRKAAAATPTPMVSIEAIALLWLV
jgi:hypothetical protein